MASDWRFVYEGLEKEILLWYSGGKGSEVRLREALLWSYMAGW